MAKKIKKTKVAADKSAPDGKLMAMVENLGDQMKIVAESNLILGDKIEAISEKIESMDERMESMDARIESMDAKMDAGFGRVWDEFDSLEKDMQSSFGTVVEYLSRLEDEIAGIKIDFVRLEEKKADKESLAGFEKRIAKIEREMEECKNLCKNK